MTEHDRKSARPGAWLKAAGLLLAFLAGAAVMIVELGVARVLTPVFGGSISVWAIVIATTMLVLALGYAFGGYRADRVGGIRVATRAASAGAVLCALVPVARVPLIEQTVGLSTLTGATIAAMVLIAPALFFLSQVSPALIRGLSGDGLSHVGVTAGGIYAVSTLGSLAGTLAAVWAFLYLPLLPAFVATGALVLVPVLLLRPATAAMAAGTGAVLLALSAAPLLALDDLHEAEQRGFELVETRSSLYGEIRVVERHGRHRYMIVNGFDQGGIDLRSRESAYRFSDGLIGLGRLYADRPSSVLLLGLGPGVVDRRLSGEGLSVDAVEIDAEVLAVAREYFDYAGDAVVDDGRRYIQRSEGTWDLIIVDAFSGGSPPWQLYTREAFDLYARHLNPGGAVILNFVGSHLDPRQRDALEAVVSTARSVFQTVHTYPDPWEPDDYPTRNIFIAATDNRRSPPLAEGSPRSAGSLSEALARSRPVEVAHGRLLTDESAPLEPLVRHTTEILRNRVREFLPVAVLLH